LADVIVRLLVRVRPREGWGSFLLALTAVLCLPAALISARENRGEAGSGGLMVVALVALAVGMHLARSRVTWAGAAATATLLGAATAAVAVGRLVPPAGLLWREALALYAWLRDLPRSAAEGPPLAELGASLSRQIELLGTRLWWSGQGAGGAQATDPVLGEILVAFLAWGCTFFAAWQIYRRRRILVGLLPAGAAIGAVAFFRAGMPVFYFFSLAFSGLWLAALQQLRREQTGWDEAGTDYPDALNVEMSMVLLPWLVAVLLLAAVWPVVRLNPVRDAFWRRMDEPWSRLVAAAERYVGPIDTDGVLGATAWGGAAGELPRAHLLGARPELLEVEVLRVWTSDPPPETGDAELPAEAYPRRYWRRSTFDTFTGRGWRNASQEAQEVASRTALTTEPPSGEELWQQFEIVEPGEPWLYAANAPYQLDVPVQAWRRANGDLVGLTGDARRYTVLSLVPEPARAELQPGGPSAASTVSTTGLATAPTLPEEVALLYLELPDTVPERVLELARRVAGTGPSHYERARRIEAYLRRYVYNLDLPLPPRDRDLVDWFLFDLQKGYCDYYASAMVVMARAAGVPARLATGYAQGAYDQEAGGWVVNALDAHSWPEIYIEDSGWVEFEPTAGQPALSRPGEAALSEEPLPPPHTRSWLRDLPWGLVALAALAVLLLAAIAWLWRVRPKASGEPAVLVRDRYARLLRWGERLGHPLRGGQTALEYSRDLGRDLGERGQVAGLPQVREASSRAPAGIERLAAALSDAQYAREPVAERTGWRVRALWPRLRRWLLWLWLAGRRRDAG
jgi:transglutaminase-like putative cysteine protease